MRGAGCGVRGAGCAVRGARYMRVSIKTKQVVGVTLIVGLVVVVLSGWYVVSLATVRLEETHARAEFLANAVRHTPSGTRLWVRLEEQEGGALISVEDEGPGVPPDMREVLFEPFRQIPGSGNHSPGVGIGLSLVRRFAELHDGRAWIEERRGGGAVFKVFLPGSVPAAST